MAMKPPPPNPETSKSSNPPEPDQPPNEPWFHNCVILGSAIACNNGGTQNNYYGMPARKRQCLTAW
jgi:hypothetical protein